ncbi:hypothetical protein MF672_002040 [Actinomadura sp. ATCC 31491]|uniref:Integrase n=1 Tax=Actinomadura luzonensis TaxID=2805427 RepID=A0ABT0FJX3_9ACTN|nr:hypothetical protein [Actinomadura luzonensis]MCK2212586.1 hypothetical protein [Actinomadura luzonensis]
MNVSGRPEADVLIKARICELLESWRPWHRRLWDVGTVHAMREAVEAADWVGRHVLSSNAMAWCVRHSLMPRLATDSALRDGEIRRQLHRVCNAPVKAGARGQRALGLLAELVADGYLRRWRDLVAEERAHVERSARCVASHMLDGGFHQEFLRQQVRAHLDGSATAVDLVELLMSLEDQGERDYEGMVVVQDKVPAPQAAVKSALWLPKEQVKAILEEAYPTATAVRASGGLLFRVRARDHISAAHEITERLDRIRNRVRYRRNHVPLDVYPKIFLTGFAEPQDFRRGDPAVNVISLERRGVLYDLPEAGTPGSRIDDALELAAALTESSPSKAVAGAWAALEALLFCDTDEADRDEGRAVAADRAAALVTAGWPRAELTSLSYDKDILAASPRLARDLAAIGGNNRERTRRMVEWLRTAPPRPVAAPATVAAFERATELAGSPAAPLGRVNRYLRASFRRLYRQRNIVLHGGSTRSLALAATVRTAGPLVGAALDRLAHGHAGVSAAPLDLAGRADLALRIAGDRDGWRLHELLGA